MAETKEKQIKLKDPVEIEYTNKAVHNPAGSTATVHSALAEKLVAKGVAKLVEKKGNKK